MTTSRSARVLGALALLPTFLVLGSAVPAHAAPPEGWEDPANDSSLQALLILGGIPIALFALIWLAASLPSIIGGTKYDSALAFREPEWFGGPRQGSGAIPASASTEERGGASADW